MTDLVFRPVSKLLYSLPSETPRPRIIQRGLDLNSVQYLPIQTGDERELCFILSIFLRFLEDPRLEMISEEGWW